MEIKTVCDGCIFKLELGGCELEKPVYRDQKQQFVKGMCGHRRDNKWAQRLTETDPDFTADQAFAYANGEHTTLTIMISALDVEMDKITDTLKSIPDEEQAVRQIIVVTQNATKDEEKAILDRLYKKKCTVWTLDNIKREEQILPLAAINYSARLVRNLWFLTVEAGDIVDLEGLIKFYKTIIIPENNYIGFYFDEDDSMRVIAHTGAFHIMDGHAEEPWLEKVKGFSNWQDVCKKIS